jgi:hypothetical protein
VALKTSAPSDELSIDVDAALASAASTPAPDVTPGAKDSSNSFFDEADAPEDEAPEETDDEDTESDEDGDYMEVSADGKSHRIDLKNKDEVKKLLSAGLGVKRAFSDLAKMRQDNKRLTQELKQVSTVREKAALMDKLETLKDDENELYRVITGGKSLDEVIEARLAKKRAWDDATPDERQQMERDERERALMQRIERMEASARVEREQAEKQNEQAEEKRAYSIAYPEFQSVFKALGIKDPIQAQETATDLWELGWARIARIVSQAESRGETVELTPEMVQKQFQSVAARWGYSSKAQAKEEVSKIISKKSKDATKRAGLAATKNYRNSSDLNELSSLSPTKAYEKLFGRR